MSAIYELVILFAILAVVVETKGEYKYISLLFFFSFTFFTIIEYKLGIYFAFYSANAHNNKKGKQYHWLL